MKVSVSVQVAEKVQDFETVPVSVQVFETVAVVELAVAQVAVSV